MKFTSQVTVTDDALSKRYTRRRATEMSMTRRWSLLTAVVIVGILAAGWFLLVSPKRSDAADLRDKAGKQRPPTTRSCRS